MWSFIFYTLSVCSFCKVMILFWQAVTGIPHTLSHTVTSSYWGPSADDSRSMSAREGVSSFVCDDKKKLCCSLRALFQVRKWLTQLQSEKAGLETVLFWKDLASASSAANLWKKDKKHFSCCCVQLIIWVDVPVCKMYNTLLSQSGIVWKKLDK